MDKKLTGLVGTIAAIVMCDGAVGAAQAEATQTDPLRAQSYAELLEPIPNASALLMHVDSTTSQGTEGRVQLADYYHHHHHHHHHHHNRYRRYVAPWLYQEHRHRRYHHHHHHHHHHHNYRHDRD